MLLSFVKLLILAQRREGGEVMLSPDIDLVQSAFFHAMAVGYAGAAERTTIPQLPGSKVIPFVWGDFKVVDLWLTTPYSPKSEGMTTIWFQNNPVWVMHYGGRYHDIDIPFIKNCLHRAYVVERRFYGGRGPQFVRGERFTYINYIERNDFEKFFGEEVVFDLNESHSGHHWYRGQCLF